MNRKVIPYLFGALLTIGSASIAEGVLIPDREDPAVVNERAWENELEEVNLQDQRLNSLEVPLSTNAPSSAVGQGPRAMATVRFK